MLDLRHGFLGEGRRRRGGESPGLSFCCFTRASVMHRILGVLQFPFSGLDWARF